MRLTTSPPPWSPSNAHPSICKLRLTSTWKFIVVDNNSTDDTAAIAEAMGARAVHESVQGIGRARNCGASAAQGDVLLFTNPLFIALFRRWKVVWSDWYRRPVR